MAKAHIEMHGDHQRWLSDQAMWRDDLAMWQQEIAKAMDGIRKLEDALRTHRATLQEHEQTIAAETPCLQNHEHALAEFERGGSGEGLLQLAVSHQQSAEKHGKQRSEHERIKKDHHIVMAYWLLLLKSLTVNSGGGEGCSELET